MDDILTALQTRAAGWIERARQAGWVEEAVAERLAAVERASPADLFVDREQRPLVVAFFGGTGVGKSSLLNRLAGQPIARTGLERPTSREVTVYVHETVQLAELPAELPLDAVRVERHRSETYRPMLWIDAPDIDSTVEANRRCALAWLPHVDLVCYVVSPERYRDDAGWQVLRQRGHRHGWVFVLNRWDEGDASQRGDFERLLRAAGFESPLLVTTCCVPGRVLPSPDQLEQLQAALHELLRTHGVRELSRLEHRARLAELHAALQAALTGFGDESAWATVARCGRESWQAAAQTIIPGAEWSIRAVAARFATRSGDVWRQIRRGLGGATLEKDAPTEADQSAADIVWLDELTGRLWDDWTQSKLQAALDATELCIRHAGLATGPLRRRLDAVADSAGTRVTRMLRDRVRLAFARPGSAAIRWLRRVTGFLMAFLPVAALTWVGWKVVQGFYAAIAPTDFLGVPFAVHSVLLVLIAWSVPFTVDRLLRPSLERVAATALRQGLEDGLDDIGQALAGSLTDSKAESHELAQQGRALVLDVAGLLIKPVEAHVPSLARVIAQRQAAAQSIDQ